jgi:hypothetical protein
MHNFYQSSITATLALADMTNDLLGGIDKKRRREEKNFGQNKHPKQEVIAAADRPPSIAIVVTLM